MRLKNQELLRATRLEAAYNGQRGASRGSSMRWRTLKSTPHCLAISHTCRASTSARPLRRANSAGRGTRLPAGSQKRQRSKSILHFTCLPWRTSTALCSWLSSSVRAAPGKGFWKMIMLSMTPCSTSSVHSSRSVLLANHTPTLLAPSSWKLPGSHSTSTSTLRTSAPRPARRCSAAHAVDHLRAARPQAYRRVHASLAMCSSPCHTASMRSSARRSVAASTWLRAEMPNTMLSQRQTPRSSVAASETFGYQPGPTYGNRLRQDCLKHGLNAVRRAQEGQGEGGVGQPVASSTPTYSACLWHACASKTRGPGWWAARSLSASSR